MNCYGLFSINRTTFNQGLVGRAANATFPKEARDRLIVFLKIHNLTLNTLGYIPGVSLFSGCARIASGITICLITLAIGDPEAKEGAIIGDWYREALMTGIAQIVRGIFEAFVPYGWAVNASLDGICTLINLRDHIASGCVSYPEDEDVILPHGSPDYPLPLLFLKLV